MLVGLVPWYVTHHKVVSSLLQLDCCCLAMQLVLDIVETIVTIK